MKEAPDNRPEDEAHRIREAWSAAVMLMAGIAQRLDGTDTAVLRQVAERVSPGSLVQVEYILIAQGLQKLCRTGESLTYENLLEAIRLLEPGQCYGWGCMMLTSLWEDRATFSVSDEDIAKALASLSAY